MGTPVTNTATASVLPRGFASNDLIRIHAVLSAYPHLETVDGIERYAERALVLPGTTLASGGPATYSRYLHDVGIGGSTITVPDGRLLTPGLTSATIGHLRRLIEGGHAIEWFQPTLREVRFVEQRLGLSYRQCVWGPTPELARQVNNKIWLRQFAANQDFRYVRFPDHIIAARTDLATIYDQAEHLLEHYGGVALKEADRASGEGIEFVYTRADWKRAVAKALQKLGPDVPQIIVEAAFRDHTPVSGQVEIDDAGPRFIKPTLNQVKNGKVHDGNVITSGQLPGLDAELLLELEFQCLEYAGALHKLGYRGWLGFDFIVVGHNLYMLECNGRVTAAMYPLLVGLQAQRNGQSNWAVASTNLKTELRLSYDQLTRLLARSKRLFDGRTGLLPICPSLIHTGKIMLHAVGNDAGEAEGMLHWMRRITRAT